jgi:glyoxylate reductase
VTTSAHAPSRDASAQRLRAHVTRRIPQVALDRLAAACDLTVGPDTSPPRAELLERARDCEGLLTLLTERVDTELLDACPKLRVVSNMAVGVDNIDVEACRARGIVVGHTPGVLTEATADFTFALLLASSRRLVEADAYVHAGRWGAWKPDLLLGRELHGATLGIIGFGGIGKAVARRAEAFGMRVLHHSRSGGVDKRTLLSQSDFVSLHLPLSQATRHFLGAEDFAQMKDGAVLINTARGGVVDQRALVEALKRGRPAFAALDVTDPEPPSPDEPLLKLPNVLLAPHLGSATVQTREAMALLAADNLIAVLQGRPAVHAVTG